MQARRGGLRVAPPGAERGVPRASSCPTCAGQRRLSAAGPRDGGERGLQDGARGSRWARSRAGPGRTRSYWAALGARVGDELSIGAGRFRIGQVLINAEAGPGRDVQDLAPSILINDADLRRRSLILPAAALFALLVRRRAARGSEPSREALRRPRKARRAAARRQRGEPADQERWIARGTSSAWRAWSRCCCARSRWPWRRVAFRCSGTSTRWR